jgi:hypothetical protein
MPARLIEDHHSMFVPGDGLCEAVEEFLHRRGIGIGQHQGEGIVRARLDGGEDIGEGETLVAEAWRALAPLPPDMTDAPLLPEARLVLKEQAKALVFMGILKFFQERWGSF